jgi:hypothetical protein
MRKPKKQDVAVVSGFVDTRLGRREGWAHILGFLGKGLTVVEDAPALQIAGFLFEPAQTATAVLEVLRSTQSLSALLDGFAVCRRELRATLSWVGSGSGRPPLDFSSCAKTLQ